MLFMAMIVLDVGRIIWSVSIGFILFSDSDPDVLLLAVEIITEMLWTRVVYKNSCKETRKMAPFGFCEFNVLVK